MHATLSNYPWTAELEKTVVHSLATTFGIDFLLFHDKKGGNVDTVHNVRDGVYATKEEAQCYEERGNYQDVKGNYHNNDQYIAKGQRDSSQQKTGVLVDGYTDNLMPSRKGVRDLDHVIAAKTVHDDAGRVLAGQEGVKLANHESNLVSTNLSINRSKQYDSVEQFLKVLPQRIEQHKSDQANNVKRLNAMPRDTPEQKNKARELEDKICKSQSKIEQLESVDPDLMREKDKVARDRYDGEINKAYYTSSKFWGKTCNDAASGGLRMGTRQMLGLVAAELWFELRERIPNIIKSMREDFSFSAFFADLAEALKGIWERLQTRFSDFLIGFKEGVFAGVLASVVTTLLNIFATTAKNTVKIIREIWGQLAKAFKLLVFNPEELSSVDLTKAVLAVLSAGAAGVVGSMVYAELMAVLSFPFGEELATFLGAVTTGIVTMGLHYFLLHSSMMQRLWISLERSNHVYTLEQFRAVNAKLDEYLNQLARVEFNLDAKALEKFADDLICCNSEIERSILLRQEIQKRQITLPYEIGNLESTQNWLISLAK